MQALVPLETYSPKGSHGAKPAAAYSARAATKSSVLPVSRLSLW